MDQIRISFSEWISSTRISGSRTLCHIFGGRTFYERIRIYLFLTETDVWPHRWLVNDTLNPLWKANHIFIISWVNEVYTLKTQYIRLRVWCCETPYTLESTESVCVSPIICSRLGRWERGGSLCRTKTWVRFQYLDTLAKHVNRIMCIVWTGARYAHTTRDAQPYVRSLIAASTSIDTQCILT